jgi:hypothetical protein
MDFRGRVWLRAAQGDGAGDLAHDDVRGARDGADEQAGQRARRVALAELLRDHLPFLFHQNPSLS